METAGCPSHKRVLSFAFVESVCVVSFLKAPASQAPEPSGNSGASSAPGARGGVKRKSTEQPEDKESRGSKEARSSTSLSAGQTNHGARRKAIPMPHRRVNSNSISTVSLAPPSPAFSLLVSCVRCVWYAVSLHFVQQYHGGPSCEHAYRLLGINVCFLTG